MNNLKYKWLIIIFLVINTVPVFSQAKQNNNMNTTNQDSEQIVQDILKKGGVDISKIFGKQDFEKTVRYILKYGDRKTYCNMYNCNPHYKYGDIDIYLNPISQWINFVKPYSDLVSDYNEIVFYDNQSNDYFFLMLIDNAVYTYNAYEYDKKEYNKQITEKYIPILKTIIKDSKPDINKISKPDAQYILKQGGMDISKIFGKQDFEQTVQYILINGDRKTYCNMYSNNPHYRYKNIDIYLNPISEWLNMIDEFSYTVSDYKEIVFRVEEFTCSSYKITLIDDKVYTYNAYEYKDSKEYNKQITEKYIPILKTIIKDSNLDIDKIRKQHFEQIAQYIIKHGGMNISEIFSKQDFEQTVQYILIKGDKSAYGNKYVCNPHYKYGDIDIYLNPISQRIDFLDPCSKLVSNYNEIYFWDKKSPYDYLVILVDDKVYTYNAYEYKDSKEYNKQILEKYIPILKTIINGRNKVKK